MQLKDLKRKKEKVICESCGKKKTLPHEPLKGTKQYEMSKDELCKFFLNLRNQIEKEGLDNLGCSTTIDFINTESDYPNRPENSILEIDTDGVYFRIFSGTPKEDRISAPSDTAKLTTSIYILNTPTQHLGNKIENPNLITVTQLYYEYLESLVEEWTGILNCAMAIS